MASSEWDSLVGAGLRDHFGRSIAGLGAGIGKHIFSGVCCRRGDRFLIATARHCLDELDLDDLHVFTMGRPNTFEPAPVIDVIRHERCDVCLIEAPRDYANLLNTTWLRLERMSSKGLAPGVQIWLIGFPSALAQRRGTGFVLCRPLIIRTTIMKRELNNDVRSQTDADADFFCEFKDPPALRVDGEELPPPTSLQGMSGCGVFTVAGPSGDELWSPSASALAGVQTGVFRQSGLIKAVRVEELANLPLPAQGAQQS